MAKAKATKKAQPSTAHEKKAGQVVYRAKIDIDNGLGRTKIENGIIVAQKYDTGEKGHYKPGDILPQSIIDQLAKFDDDGKDTQEGVLYVRDIATDDELAEAELEAVSANKGEPDEEFTAPNE